MKTLAEFAGAMVLVLAIVAVVVIDLMDTLRRYDDAMFNE